MAIHCDTYTWPVHRPCILSAELLASSVSMCPHVYHMFTTCLPQHSLRAYAFSMPWSRGQARRIGREKQISHNEDVKGSCMEIEPSPPSNPYGIHP